MRRLLILLLVLTLLPFGVLAQEDEKPVLRIAVLPVLNTLPLYVAEAEGFYEDQGVTVELIPFNSAREQQIALQAEEVDGANTDLVVTALLINGGVDLKVIRMEPIEGAYFSLVAGPETGIESIDDLRGVAIAISENSIIQFLTQQMLEEAGFAEDDIVYESVPQIPIRLELLATGGVSAATLPEPLTTLATQLQGGTVIASDADLPAVPTVLSFSDAMLESYPETIIAFLAAYEQAVEAINDDPEAFRDVMVENIIIPEPLQAEYPVPTFPTAMVPSEEVVELVNEWMVSVELLDEPLEYDTIIDASYLPEVEVEED